jgi:acyl carrier protein
MIDQGEIAGRVQRVLSQVLDVPVESVGDDLSATTSPVWSSLNHLMMMSQLEDEFGVVFTSQEIQDLTSYTAIVRTVSGRLASGA